MVCERFKGFEEGTQKVTALGAISGPRECPLLENNTDCNSEELCLQGSEGNHEGNVFFNHQPVCDDSWGFLEAEVVCHQLGFPQALRATDRSSFGLVSRVFSLDEVQCKGNESRLADCRHSSVENCDGTEGAGVICDNRTMEKVNSENENTIKSCFAKDLYYASWLQQIKKEARLNNSVVCQKLCSFTEGCQAFLFKEGDQENCVLLGAIQAGGETVLEQGTIIGPRQCLTQAPELHSFLQEDCSANGVACVSGGLGPYEGVAHVGGQPICQDGWTNASATVFCKQMGYRAAVEKWIEPRSYGEAQGPFNMNHVQCLGHEENVEQCSHDTGRSCLQWQGATVRCETLEEYVVPGPDCSELCLQGGLIPSQGNVYVRDRPVCDDQWGMEEARVVCHQLGYPGAKDFTNLGKFGPATAGFLMSNVTCGGEERRVTDCRHNTDPKCSSTEAAGVVCLPMSHHHPAQLSKRKKKCQLLVSSGSWANMDADRQFHRDNVLQDDCDSFSWGPPPTANYWLAPAGTPSRLVLDLGCVRVLDTLMLKNTHNGHHNDRGTKDFRLYVSNSTSGHWRLILNGSLEDARNRTCDVPLQAFHLDSSSLTEKTRTFQAIRLEVFTWYGLGAGLQYLTIRSHRPSSSLPDVLGATAGLVLVAMAIATLIWARKRGLVSWGVGHREHIENAVIVEEEVHQEDNGQINQLFSNL